MTVKKPTVTGTGRHATGTDVTTQTPHGVPTTGATETVGGAGVNGNGLSMANLQADPSIMSVLQNAENHDNSTPMRVAGYQVINNGTGGLSVTGAGQIIVVYYKNPDGSIEPSRYSQMSFDTLNSWRSASFNTNPEPLPAKYFSFAETQKAGGSNDPASFDQAASGSHSANPMRQYTQVDNGVSSLAGYGFGEGNRYTQGAPTGGYAQPTVTGGVTGGGTRTAPGIPGSTPSFATSSAGTGSGPVTGGAPGASTGAANTSGLSTAQRDAWAYLKGILDQYGLGSLSQFVITELTAGRSQEEIALDLQQTPQFKAAFPEIAARQAAGLPAVSPGEIVSYRNSAVQLMRAAGLPQGFYDSPQDVQNLISSDVSLSELNDRINAAKDATYNVDPAAQARLYQEFGLAPGSGSLAAFFLDDKKALPLLQRQVQAAQIGGAADQVGYGGLNNATALDLAQAGVTSAQARQGFNTLGMEGQLFTGLPGENAKGIGQGQQLAAQFLGNVDAQQTIERRRQSRQATFADGGSFAGTSKGIGGLGAADGI